MTPLTNGAERGKILFHKDKGVSLDHRGAFIFCFVDGILAVQRSIEVLFYIAFFIPEYQLFHKKGGKT